jgi:hypothetical protein
MPKVCGTPLGRPVEPEVNRYLATCAWVSASRAASTAAVGGVEMRSANGTTPSATPPCATTSRSGFRARKVSSARANIAASCTNTALGFTVATQCFSLAWSVEIRL